MLPLLEPNFNPPRYVPAPLILADTHAFSIEAAKLFGQAIYVFRPILSTLTGSLAGAIARVDVSQRLRVDFCDLSSVAAPTQQVLGSAGAPLFLPRAMHPARPEAALTHVSRQEGP